MIGDDVELLARRVEQGSEDQVRSSCRLTLEKGPPSRPFLMRGAQWAAGAAPPSFTLRRLSASGTAASESSVNTQKTSI